MISRSLRWLVASALTTGCGQAQGPANASFEDTGCDSFCSGETGIPSAAQWDLFRTNDGTFGHPYPRRSAGTGFVPTDGTYFIALPAESGFSASEAGIRQDDVDLSTTTALLFDYEAIGTVPQGADADGTATVEVLFTAMGTATLWSKSYPVGTVSEQVFDMTAMVDKPPTAGRLTIRVTVVSAMSGGAKLQTDLEFRIDNLRVQ